MSKRVSERASELVGGVQHCVQTKYTLANLSVLYQPICIVSTYLYCINLSVVSTYLLYQPICIVSTYLCCINLSVVSTYLYCINLSVLYQPICCINLSVLYQPICVVSTYLYCINLSVLYQQKSTSKSGREKGVEDMHGSFIPKTSPYSCSHNEPAVVLGIKLSHVGGPDVRLGRPV